MWGVGFVRNISHLRSFWVGGVLLFTNILHLKMQFLFLSELRWQVLVDSSASPQNDKTKDSETNSE